MYKTILVGVDGSTYSEKALAEACDLANLNESKIHLIHVSSYQYIVAGDAGVEVMSKQDVEETGRSLLEKMASKARELGCSSVDLHYRDDSPGKAILSTADEIDADLIVVGSKGHSDLAGLMLGSVSHKICNMAGCSCLIVR